MSKGISAGRAATATALVQVAPSAEGARNYSQCDSMLIGDKAGANTYPYIAVREAVRAGGARGVHVEDWRGSAISFPAARHRSGGGGGHHHPGFCNEVFNELPLEFAAEVNQLMSLKLEGSVG